MSDELLVLRHGIEHVLQESDETRELDSLEVMTVRAYLVGKGIRFDAADDELPTTIGGWLTWAARCSPAS